ncbi:hypothetical protein T484DRAFT_3631144 [Baffinella frigidus]|nr:hypothetical protein T484DRAFT_3631144 [Cryptophyta sp. CCMP2293]
MEPSFPGAQHGGSSAPAGATMEEASHARSCGDREPVGGRKASDEGREGAPPFKAVLALRKKKERAQTSELWATMELLAPTLEENKGVPGGQRCYPPPTPLHPPFRPRNEERETLGGEPAPLRILRLVGRDVPAPPGFWGGVDPEAPRPSNPL